MLTSEYRLFNYPPGDRITYGVAESRYERDKSVSGEIGAGSGEQTDNSVATTENHTLNQQRLTYDGVARPSNVNTLDRTSTDCDPSTWQQWHYQSRPK
jgi:hypothetical protein